MCILNHFYIKLLIVFIYYEYFLKEKVKLLIKIHEMIEIKNVGEIRLHGRLNHFVGYSPMA